MNNNKELNSEVWICKNEFFNPRKNVIKTKNEKRKKKHHKMKFFLVPLIVFYIVNNMLRNNIREYEDKKTIYYIVKEGDTLWDISRKYLGKGYKYLQIAYENNIDNPDLIYAGEEYKITIIYKQRVRE